MAVKLCKDCVWYVKEGSCQAPQNRIPMKQSDLVDGFIPNPGATAPRWFTYNALRSRGWLGARLFQQCGKGGRWWVHISWSQ